MLAKMTEKSTTGIVFRNPESQGEGEACGPGRPLERPVLVQRRVWRFEGVPLLVILGGLILSLCQGCAPRMVIRDGKEIPIEVAASQDFSEAEDLFQGRKWEESFLKYRQILTRYPKMRWADDALFRMGEIRLQQKRYLEAVELFADFIERFPGSGLKSSAVLRMAICHQRMGELEGMVALLEKYQGQLRGPDRVKAEYLLAQGYEELERYGEALCTYQKALPEMDPEKQTEVKQAVVSIIRSRLTTSELSRLLPEVQPDYFLAEVLIELTRRRIDEHDWKGAEQFLAEELGRYPRFERRSEVESFLTGIRDRNIVDPYQIGLILPLSGRYQQFGEQAFMGSLLAAGVFGDESGSPGEPFRLLVRDSEGDPQVAVQAVEDLILRNHVIAIIGPLLSPTSEAAAKRAEDFGVPLIALSQKEGLPQEKDYVFRLGLTHSQQVSMLTDYTLNTLDIKRYAVLYPRDNYGEDLLFLFWDKVVESGGEIRGVEGYDPNATDFGDQIKSIIGLSEPSRWEERVLAKAGIEISPIVDFDAVFIPDSYRRGGLIAPQLAYYGVTNVRVLGTGAFNNPELIKLGREHVEDAVFVDGFYRASSRPQTYEFCQKYYQEFAQDPTIISAQAYDATRLIIRLARDFGVKDRESLRQSLLGVEGYAGATGNIHIDTDGEILRPLFLLTVKRKRFEEIRQ